jgi:broad specificity phosphatase PhoE
MTRLHLIRHGRPLVDAHASPSTWRLAVDDEPFVTLAASSGFPRSARWVSSDEPKAVDTARRLRSLLDLPADDIDPTASLREMRRPAVLPDEAAFRRAVVRSLRNPGEPAAPGWETGASVRERVRAEVVRRCTEQTRDGCADVVLVGHGTAWSLLVAAILDRPVDVAGWQRLRMPDWCVLDVEATDGRVDGSLVADWGAWTIRRSADPRPD